jgi:hypothetical protein
MIQTPDDNMLFASGLVVTHTGKIFDLRSPDPSLVDIRDIARGLSRVNLFSGQTSLPFTVAQHSVNVSNWCRAEDAPAALLIRAAAAYLGDVSPARALVPELRILHSRILAAVFDAFELEANESTLQQIEYWESIALSTEVHSLFPLDVMKRWPHRLAPRMASDIPAMHYDRAETFFMRRFLRLSRSVRSFEIHVGEVAADWAHRLAEGPQRPAGGEQSQVSK